VTKVKQIKHPTGGWFVDPRLVTKRESEALLQALETAEGGERYSIMEHIQSMPPAAPQQEQDDVDQGPGDESDARRIRTEDALHAFMAHTPFSPRNLLEFVEAAEMWVHPCLFEPLRLRIEQGIRSWAEVRTAIVDVFWPGRGPEGRAVRPPRDKPYKPPTIPAWINVARTTVTAHDERCYYKTHIPTGFHKDYLHMQDQELVKALVRGAPFLIPHTQKNVRKWGKPGMPEGWMYTATQWYVNPDGTCGVDGYFIERAENGAPCRFKTEFLRGVMEGLQGAPATVTAWLSEEDHGRKGATGLDGFVPPLLAYWEQQPDRPAEIARRMTARTGVERAQVNNSEQQMLPAREAQEGGRSWLDPVSRPRPAEEAIECVIDMGTTQVETEESDTGHIEYRKASAVHVVKEKTGTVDKWAVERAKAKQWLARRQQGWSELRVEADTMVREVERREEEGYRTPAWQLTQSIAATAGLDTIIGPTVWEVDPTFKHWEWHEEACPLLLLDAVHPEQRCQQIQRAVQGGSWAVLTTGTTGEQQRLLQDAGAGYVLNYEKIRSVFQKGWWQTGNKKLCLGLKWELWIPRGVQPPAVIDPTKEWVVPWLEPAPLDRPDLEVYYDHLPAGVYRKAAGTIIWTDGSQRTVRDRGAVAGAGYITNASVVSHRRVGGTPTAMRAEMAAAAMAVWDTPLDEPLTVITDSLSMLWILRQWRRRDFSYWIDQEQHDDILKSMLARIRVRTAPTTFVWCKAHAGNPGNELADTQANQGCFDDQDMVWERDETATILRNPPGANGLGDVVSWDGWSRRATKQGSIFVKGLLKRHLAATSNAISTQSLVKADRGRRYLGEALASPDVPPLAKRDMLQARSFAFPTAAVVSRYTQGKTSAACVYCKAEVETFGHFQCACKAFKGARQTAHDTIAEVLIDAVAEHHEGAIVEKDEEMGKTFPGCSEAVRRLRPDGLIIDHERKEAFVVEFTRGMMEEGIDQRARDREKHAKYHRIILLLREELHGYKILQTNFIMGVLTSIDEEAWARQLDKLGVPEKACESIFRRCVRAGVMALHHMANARRAATEEIKTGGRIAEEPVAKAGTRPRAEGEQREGAGLDGESGAQARGKRRKTGVGKNSIRSDHRAGRMDTGKRGDPGNIHGTRRGKEAS